MNKKHMERNIMEGILQGKGIPPILKSENETTVEVIEGIKHSYGPPSPPGSENQTRLRIDYKKIYTMIFTNGEIIYTGEKETYNAEELLRCKNKQLNTKLIKFYDSIDSINIYHVNVKNADYIIKVLVGEELLKGAKSAGFYHVIQDKDVYLKNSKDKETAKQVKEILKMLKRNDITLSGFKYPKINLDEPEKKKTKVQVKKIRQKCHN